MRFKRANKKRKGIMPVLNCKSQITEANWTIRDQSITYEEPRWANLRNCNPLISPRMPTIQIDLPNVRF